MGGGFGGCTINLVRNDIHSKFIADAKRKRFNRNMVTKPRSMTSISATARANFVSTEKELR